MEQPARFGNIGKTVGNVPCPYRTEHRFNIVNLRIKLRQILPECFKQLQQGDLLTASNIICLIQGIRIIRQ